MFMVSCQWMTDVMEDADCFEHSKTPCVVCHAVAAGEYDDATNNPWDHLKMVFQRMAITMEGYIFWHWQGVRSQDCEYGLTLILFDKFNLSIPYVIHWTKYFFK